MPKTSHSIEIRAPLERLWALLTDGIADPGRFLPGIAGAEILEREAGSLLRRIRTSDFEVTERVTPFKKRHEINFVLVDHPHYAGQSVQRIETLYETDEPGLTLTLHFSLDWRRKDRDADELDLSGWVSAALQRIKTLAEEA